MSAPFVIDARNLTKRYDIGDNVISALSGVSIEIAAKEFVAIMGPSGCGKTTLMNLLGLLDQPSSGSLFFDGEEVTRLSSNHLTRLRRTKIGFVFQIFNLLSRNTALENVELPLMYQGLASSERRRLATEALEFVGLANRGKHWPEQLSGGEQQRVAIARAIVSRPRLILADEPTGALDSHTGHRVLALFEELHRTGRTIILVTHDRDVAKRAGRKIRMKDGRIEKPDDHQVLTEGGDRTDAQKKLDLSC